MVEPLQLELNFNGVDFGTKISRFVRLSSTVTTSVDVVSGRYRVDGKSIMGLFSLDLSKPFVVEVNPIEKDFIELLKHEFEKEVV